MANMNLKSPLYPVTPTASSQSLSITPEDSGASSLIAYNSTTVDVFVSTSVGTGTVAFPTPGTATNGTVIGPGQMVTFTKQPWDDHINYIQNTAGSGNMYFKVGQGD